MTERVLIIGKNGQVGRHLVRCFPGATAWGRDELDLSSSSTINAKIRSLKPNWVINASAYTAVDKAETEEALALQVNGHAVGEIARTCAEIDAGLVHFSTDYVFDGVKSGAYTVDDATNPVNAYGRSKLAGEQNIARSCKRYWIFRTSWVFSEYAPNFLKTMVKLGSDRSQLEIVNDQFGKPTYAGELARITSLLVQGGFALESGIHHLACPEATTWFEFAKVIFAQAELALPEYKSPRLIGVSSEAYMTTARRPQNSVLQSSSNISLTHWAEFVQRCVV